MEHRTTKPVPQPWVCQEGQRLAFLVPYHVKQILLEGNRGSGKSDCLLISFLRGVGKGFGPAWKGYLFKRTVPEVQPLFEKAKALYLANCPTVKYTQHPYCKFIWPGGEMLTLRHMLDIDDDADLHGSEVTWIGWEELTNWPTPEVYLRCMSLLRSAHPEASQMMQVWATTNPGQIGHRWVQRRWQLPHMRNTLIYDSEDASELARWSDDPLLNVKPRPRVAIFLDVRKNHVFLSKNPTYLADIAREAPNDAVRRAWIDGDWDIVAGGMFDDVWDQRYHVVKPFPIPRTWRIDRSLDWGSSSPFAVLWYAESDGCDYQDSEGVWHSSIPGDIFVIHEWYGTTGQINTGLKLTADEVARGIIERELEWGIYDRVHPGPADNQIHQELQAGQNIAADFLRPVRLSDGREFPGVQWTRSDKGEGSRVTGWNMIRDRLKRCIPDQKSPTLRELPGLFFFKTLQHTLQHFPISPRDEKMPEDLPKRGEFHLQDSLRYRILADGRPMTQGPTVGKY
jgi:hypothetical protein